MIRSCRRLSSVGLGHRRLAVIDPLPEANQPFASHDGRYLLVYNGELYNYRELKQELETHGVRFRTRSDSEPGKQKLSSASLGLRFAPRPSRLGA